jgi:hypothetical protein
VKSVGGAAIRRLRRRGGGDVAPVDAAGLPVDELTFVCTSCRREMDESERSKIATGRCRACV